MTAFLQLLLDEPAARHLFALTWASVGLVIAVVIARCAGGGR
jgi:hypothetical protein